MTAATRLRRHPGVLWAAAVVSGFTAQIPWTPIWVASTAVWSAAILGLGYVAAAGAWDWVRENGWRKTVRATAWNVGYFGPILWLAQAGWWWPTAIATGAGWAVGYIAVTGIAMGFIRGIRADRAAR